MIWKQAGGVLLERAGEISQGDVGDEILKQFSAAQRSSLESDGHPGDVATAGEQHPLHHMEKSWHGGSRGGRGGRWSSLGRNHPQGKGIGLEGAGGGY